MSGAIALARAAAEELLIQCARALGSGAGPSPEAIRFRPDGKGGELASPFPMTARLDPGALARAAGPSEWFEAVYPSGSWIALDLSDAWRELVRHSAPTPPPRNDPVLPPPPFPARIEPPLWRLDALAGITGPETAARLDRGNPAFRLRLALGRAKRGAGGNRPDRLLVNEAALLTDLLERPGGARAPALQLLRLSEAYLARPGEDALVARTLLIASKSLGI